MMRIFSDWYSLVFISLQFFIVYGLKIYISVSDFMDTTLCFTWLWNVQHMQ